MTATRRAVAPLDEAARRRHKLRNAVQSVLLLGGMVALLGACVWLIFGPDGALWGLFAWAVALLFSPRLSPALMLRMYRARRLGPYDFPAGFRILEDLTRRAGLERMPALYYVPSPTVGAFTLGRRDDAAIAVTDGLLRTLNGRELAGVLAHEISHVRNNDLWIMNLADAISRLTGMMAYAGILLIFVMLPVLVLGGGGFPWVLVLLLVFAPTIGSLLQLALSRAREYEADLDGAGLTGDPAALASALDKLERLQGGMWERILMPGRRVPVPSLLRTHPPTEERIRRLLALYAPAPAAFEEEIPVILPPGTPAPRRAPRWRASGLWY